MTNDVATVWSNELSNLLIFASLFSSVLSAFTVEAAKALEVDPAERTVRLLRTLVLQVNNVLDPQANVPIDLNPEISLTITPHAQHIYLLYSVSLALSLIAVLGGITCLQWLREFNRNITGVSHNSDIYLQHLRHRSLRSWGVLTFLNMLPILLLIALFLFFAGFLTSQLGSNSLAAKPVTVLVAIAGLFTFITSCLPALQVVWLANYRKHVFTFQDPSDEPEPPVLCPYRSPQAWFVHCIFQYLLRFIQRTLSHKIEPRCLMPFGKINTWTGYDMWWTEKHKTTKHIYPALKWVATEFKQSRDVVATVCQCFMSTFADTCYEYLPKLRETYYEEQAQMSVPATAWVALGASTLVSFEEEFVSQNTVDISSARFGTFSKIWETLRKSSLHPSSDLYAILRVDKEYSHGRDLLEAIKNALEKRTRGDWSTEVSASTAACYAIHHDPRLWFDTIPILAQLCERYQQGNRSLQPLRQLCDKLRETLSSEHRCNDLVKIFYRVFPYVQAEHLEGLGATLGTLLVRCDDCYVPFWVTKPFLEIVTSLASQRLIGRAHSLDNIFLYTTHILERSSGLPQILPTVEKTLNTIYSAAVDLVQHSDASTISNCVLLPSQFSIPRNIPHPDFPIYELKPVWDLTDDFNVKLKEVWARRHGQVGGSHVEGAAQPRRRKVGGG